LTPPARAGEILLLIPPDDDCMTMMKHQALLLFALLLSALAFTPQEVLENMTPPEGMEKLYSKLETVASTWKE
jgi:hypothetical protein